MRAIVQERYGRSSEVLRLKEVEPPVVKNDQLLVRIKAASVHPDVWHVVNGWPYVLRWMGSGVRKPKQAIPGTDFSGIVERVGADVTKFKVGYEVFGETHRGFQWVNGGAFAEYASVPHDVVALKPPNVSFEQAAAVPTSGIIVLFNLQNGRRVNPGDHVLVNGAAGGVGSIVVQLAKARGARVTGVDHGSKLDLVRTLGADAVIDYTSEDITQTRERFDLIVDVASTLNLAQCKQMLTPAGTFIVIGHDHYGAAHGRILGSIPQMFKLMALSPFVKQIPKPDFSPPSKQEALAVLSELLRTGQLTPIIDTVYPLDQVVAAMDHLEQGRAHGRILLRP